MQISLWFVFSFFVCGGVIRGACFNRGCSCFLFRNLFFIPHNRIGGECEPKNTCATWFCFPTFSVWSKLKWHCDCWAWAGEGTQKKAVHVNRRMFSKANVRQFVQQNGMESNIESSNTVFYEAYPLTIYIPIYPRPFSFLFLFFFSSSVNFSLNVT